MIPQLSAGVLQRIISGEHVDNPVLQLLGYKKIPGNAEKYRLLLSDGVYIYNVSMLATQLNSRIVNGEFEKFTVVKLDRYTVNHVNEKKIIIILDVTVLASPDVVRDRIGNPTNLDVKDGAPASMPAANNQFQANRPSATPANGLDGANVSVHPVSSLTPYQNKWTIKARVTNKTPIRTYSNSRGEGKLFSMDLLDHSGEIRATAFNDQVDKFYDSIEINKVYYISKASVKTANKNFTTIKNDYEMTFNSETTMVLCNDDVNLVPTLQFEFMPISQIQNVDADAIIDVIGICKSAADVMTFVSRNSGKEMTKREVVLLDDSCTDISLTLWGSEATNFDGSANPVVAIRGAKVSTFGGRSLSVLNSSVIQLNPDIRQAHKLRGWYDREGSNVHSQSMTVKGGGGGMNTNWKTFAQMKGENLGVGEKPDFFSTKASIVMVKRENCLYQACPTEDCNKKVTDLNNGLFRCERCNREHQNFKWRLLLQMNVADFSDSQWVTCFQESGETVLGITAQELGHLKETNEDKFNEVLTNTNFKSFIFRLRTKMETYNDESRLKTIVHSATTMNAVEYGNKLLTDIKHLESVI